MRYWNTTTLLVWALLGASHATTDDYSHTTKAFRQWYPTMRERFTAILQNDCSLEYQQYLTGEVGLNGLPMLLGAGGMFWANLSCLLGNLMESEKSNMAAAGVALGLLPTILAQAGPSPMEMGLLALRRPVLGFILSAASPALNPFRAFDYRNPAKIPRWKPGDVVAHKGQPISAVAIGVAELIVGSAALANVMMVVVDLTTRCIFIVSMQTTYLAILWVSIAFVLHVGGAACVYLRVNIKTSENHVPAKGLLRLNEWIAHESTTCANHGKVTFSPKPDTYWFAVLSWFVSTTTIVYITFGTLMFSGAQFICLLDAVIIVTRLLFSVIICRAILLYELSGLWAAADFDKTFRKGLDA
ncbi:hypothetical protein LTR48_006847 [Friedmanniomyces endolithicus]|uniref:Uncharacterized protein n=1 Tax=Rachicladosporium monterosium TaxID=1507873 RepID=A0ABR0KXU2_9PEZI|nr:hypothetical protein LTR29_001157 [Friedmanniomyces endolithicus]KAK1091166.1 hypothetical protein LTR48_006847 [Friedmanniomyces endolithicus]KAK5140339.1 hypothetical protein LTR32_006827 [Rachicladosporium monterosium]